MANEQAQQVPVGDIDWDQRGAQDAYQDRCENALYSSVHLTYPKGDEPVAWHKATPPGYVPPAVWPRYLLGYANAAEHLAGDWAGVAKRIDRAVLAKFIDEQQATLAYHKPSEEQIRRIHNVREVCKHALEVVALNVGNAASRDLQLAVEHITDAMMRANRAIVNEKTPGKG